MTPCLESTGQGRRSPRTRKTSSWCRAPRRVNPLLDPIEQDHPGIGAGDGFDTRDARVEANQDVHRRGAQRVLDSPEPGDPAQEVVLVGVRHAVAVIRWSSTA